jgi:hypothetical protein
VEITGGEVWDYKGFDLMMGDPTGLPRILIADRDMTPIMFEMSWSEPAA